MPLDQIKIFISRNYRLLFSVFIYLSINFFVIWWGDFYPFVTDNHESYSTLGHGYNLLNFEISESWGLADEVFVKDPQAHPYAHTHQGNFSRIFSAILHFFGAKTVGIHIVISLFTIGLASIIFAYKFFEKLGGKTFSFLVCLFLSTDYLLFIQWQVNGYRVWQGFFFFSTLLIVKKIQESQSKKLYFTLLFLNVYCLFYGELIYATFLAVLAILYSFYINLRSVKRFFWTTVTVAIASVLSFCTVIIQWIGYLGWQRFKQDAYLTFVARNKAFSVKGLMENIVHFYNENPIVFFHSFNNLSIFSDPRDFFLNAFYSVLGCQVKLYSPFFVVSLLFVFAFLLTYVPISIYYKKIKDCFFALCNFFEYLAPEVEGDLKKEFFEKSISFQLVGGILFSAFLLLISFFYIDFMGKSIIQKLIIFCLFFFCIMIFYGIFLYTVKTLSTFKRRDILPNIANIANIVNKPLFNINKTLFSLFLLFFCVIFLIFSKKFLFLSFLCLFVLTPFIKTKYSFALAGFISLIFSLKFFNKEDFITVLFLYIPSTVQKSIMFFILALIFIIFLNKDNIKVSKKIKNKVIMNVLFFYIISLISFFVIFFLSPGYVLSGYVTRYSTFTVYYHFVPYALSLLFFWYLFIGKIEMRNNRLRYILKIPFVVFLGVWACVNIFYFVKLPPTQYSFIELFKKEPFKGKTFAMNNYTAPISSESGAWGYFDEGMKDYKITLSDEKGFFVDRSLKYLWFRDKKTNKKYLSPQLYVCKYLPTVNEVFSKTLLKKEKNYTSRVKLQKMERCKLESIYQFSKIPFSIMSNKVVAEHQGSAATIISLDWLYPPFLKSFNEGGKKQTVKIKFNAKKSLLSLKYCFSHQQNHKDTGTLFSIYKLLKDDKSSSGYKKKKLFSGVNVKKLKTSSFSDGSYLITLQPTIRDKKGPKYLSRIELKGGKVISINENVKPFVKMVNISEISLPKNYKDIINSLFLLGGFEVFEIRKKGIYAATDLGMPLKRVYEWSYFI